MVVVVDEDGTLIELVEVVIMMVMMLMIDKSAEDSSSNQ